MAYPISITYPRSTSRGHSVVAAYIVAVAFACGLNGVVQTALFNRKLHNNSWVDRAGQDDGHVLRGSVSKSYCYYYYMGRALVAHQQSRATV